MLQGRARWENRADTQANATPGSGAQRWERHRSGRSTGEHRRDRGAHVGRTVQILSEGNASEWGSE